jgi:hypothetical protein
MKYVESNNKMSKTDKVDLARKHLSRVKKEIRSYVKDYRMIFIDDLEGWFTLREEDRLVLSYFAGGQTIGYYPSQKAIRKGLLKFLKTQTPELKVYRKPSPFVSISKVS